MNHNVRLKEAVQVILFAFLGGLILYFMWQSQGKAYAEECVIQNITKEDCSLFQKLVHDYSHADWFWLVVISLCFSLSQIFRAIRWKLMLRPMGFDPSFLNCLASILVGYFANLGIPRVGEFVRAGILTKYEKLPVEKAFASIVVERIVDVLLLLVFIILGFIFHYDVLLSYMSRNTSFSTQDIIYTILVISIVGIMGLYLLKRILALDDSHLHPAFKKIKNLISGFLEGLVSIRRMPNVGTFIAYSLGIWVLYFLMNYLAFFAYEPVAHLSPIDGLLVFDFASLGIVFPSPGGMGSYHFMVVEALKILDIAALPAFTFAMINFFTITIFCTVLLGMFGLIALPIINRKKK